MAVTFHQKSAGNSATTTLASGVTNSDTSFPLVSDTNFLSGGGMVIVDEGEATEELAYYTGKSGGALTVPLANRGLEGGSAQAHASGATVKGIFSADMWNNVIETLANGFSATDGTLDTTKVVAMTGDQTVAGAKTFSSVVATSAGIKNTPRIVTTTDDATAEINTDITDQYQLTAVANATTFTVTGTPVAGQKLIVRIKDAGVAKGLTWTGFTNRGATAPTTTVAGKTHYVGCIYNATASTWDVVAAIVES